MYVKVLLILVAGLALLIWAYRRKHPVLQAFIATAMVICTAGVMFHCGWTILPTVETAARRIVADSWKDVLQKHTDAEGLTEFVKCSPGAVREVQVSFNSPAVYFFRQKDGICFLKIMKAGTDADPHLEVTLESMPYMGNEKLTTTGVSALIGKPNGITMLDHNGKSFLATPVPDPDGLVRYTVVLFDKKIPDDTLLELHQKPELLKTLPGKMIHLNVVVQ